ncbi:MAG: sulfotransferase domain-containing protein [Ilumatobacteraceae bacterium]
MRRSRSIRRFARRFALRIRAVSRWPTAPLRSDPSFIIIGAQKAATSSLYRRLADLPGVEPALRKEVHFFENDRVHRLGQSYYRAHFPLRHRLRRPDGGRAVTGEATPNYLVSVTAARRIAEALPGCRFVVVLRDPVSRAISSYHHRRRNGKETREIDEALLTSLESAAAFLEGSHDAFARDSYVTWGLYARHLATWYELVGDERMLVVGMDALIDDFTSTLPLIAAFIGAGDDPPVVGLPHLNRGDRHGDPSAEVVAQLRSFFAGPDRELRDLLEAHQPGRPLPRWLQSSERSSSGRGR